MIVRFDLERASPTVADIDDAGVLARPLDHQLAACGQAFQMYARRLVRAVLAPHHAEDTELGERRLAAERVLDALVLIRRNAVIGDDFRSNRDGPRSGHRRMSLLSHVCCKLDLGLIERTAWDYTDSTNEIHHHRYRRTHRSRQDRAVQSSDWADRRPPGR